MQEKAHIFFLLLDRMYKIDASEKLEQIAIVATPHMKKEDASSIISSYKQLSSDIIEVIEDNDDYSNLQRLKIALKKT